MYGSRVRFPEKNSEIHIFTIIFASYCCIMKIFMVCFQATFQWDFWRCIFITRLSMSISIFVVAIRIELSKCSFVFIMSFQIIHFHNSHTFLTNETNSFFLFFNEKEFSGPLFLESTGFVSDFSFFGSMLNIKISSL